jgi:hypothetical protein
VAFVDRQVLLAPDVVARAAAAAVRDRRGRWMLRQPRPVRRSYAQQVHGRHDEDERAMAWMLRQPGHVRESFVRHVIGDRDDREAREQRWMLLQDEPVRLSYLSDVLEVEAGEP